MKKSSHIDVLNCIQNKDRKDRMGKAARKGLYFYLRKVLYRSQEPDWIKIRDRLRVLPTGMAHWVREKAWPKKDKRLRQDDFLPFVYGEILASSPTDVDREQDAKAWVKTIANNVSKSLVTQFYKRKKIAPVTVKGGVDALSYQSHRCRSPIDIIINVEDEIKAEAKAKREGKDYPQSRKQLAKERSNWKYERKKLLTREILQGGYAPRSLSENLCKVLEKPSLADVTNEELKLIGRLSKNSIINDHVDDVIFQRSA
tara:strand:+ start:1323 stop:2093 length:771 start_codon:yes stop_codon:yes gene_type:complete